MNGDPVLSTMPAAGGAATAVRRPGVRFLLSHPAHWVALGFGSGLSPVAPGTVGTLWAWLAFVVLWPWMSGIAWALLLGASLLGGVWACTVTARHLGTADPGAIVWDEVVAFWFVLWLLMPVGFWSQFAAFVLFRTFDAVKRGPVGWADRMVSWRAGEALGWRHGAGIVFDDLVAAVVTLVVMAVAARVLGVWGV
jgi:phosphatidylglycerophosphatase A